MDDSNGSWDFDARHTRDLDREPTYGQRRRPKLVATGTVRQAFVCTSAYHEALKDSPEWDELPFANAARPRIVHERCGDEPAELAEYRNHSCGSTICKVIATDEQPQWLAMLREAGLV